MGSKWFGETSDLELSHILLDISNKYFAGEWSPRMEDFNRWKPEGVSRANRQLSKRGLRESKDSWRDLMFRLTGREPKPLTKIIRNAEPLPKKELKPYKPYWKKKLWQATPGMQAIEGYRVVGEWCPITLKYVPTHCEKVLLLR